MSLLERLKQEDAAKREAAELVAREREARERTYREHIDPRMHRLVQHLEETAKTLISLKPTVRASMSLTGYGDIVAQPLWDYRVEHDRRLRDWVLKLSWTWRLDPEQSPAVRADSGAKCRTLIAAFRSHQLAGVKEEVRNRAGDEIVVATFQARGLIRASLEATISVDDPILRMAFTNASWLGTSQRQLSWVHIGAELFDKLVRFLVREDDTLFTEDFTAPNEIEEPVPAPVPEVRASARSAPPIEIEELPLTLPVVAATESLPPPEPASMDDVLEAIPDPTAALIAALGIDEASAGSSALSMDDWTLPAPAPSAPTPNQATQPPTSVPPEAVASPSEAERSDPSTGPARSSTLAGASSPVSEDFEPLTRTEAALIAKLRRKTSGAAPANAPPSQPSATTAKPTQPAATSGPPNTDPAAPTDSQRLDAAAFRRRMSGMLSRLREDEDPASGG
ncbi:MAG: hypothetical protein KDI56_14190 [Xanthomonadales bacterium]|nr:hypothetical protein [Xanthomonadales bacterium]